MVFVPTLSTFNLWGDAIKYVDAKNWINIEIRKIRSCNPRTRVAVVLISLNHFQYISQLNPSHSLTVNTMSITETSQ